MSPAPLTTAPSRPKIAAAAPRVVTFVEVPDPGGACWAAALDILLEAGRDPVEEAEPTP
jgi:hypothetical protein